MDDRKIRIGAVLSVAAFAAVISFKHISHLALAHGHDKLSSALLPLCVDGVIVVATLSMRHAKGFWKGWARCLLLAGVGATAAANMAYGAQWGWTGMLIWAWPAVAFFGCAELAVGMARKEPAKPEKKRKPAAEEHPAVARMRALALVPDGSQEAAARQAWLESGQSLSDRTLAREHGRSRTYWTKRIAEWREATA